MENTKKIGVMLDCSRNMIMNVAGIKNFIDIIAKIGYNRLMLYTEDTYEIKGEPMFGYLRGRYSGEEIKEIDNYALSKGVELVPCIQTLAHLHQLSRWIPYLEMFDTSTTLLLDDERVYDLIDKMFASCAENYTTKNIHIGMDEAHDMGLGKYLDIHGYQDRSELFLRHLNRVYEIAKKHGLKPMIWSDMPFRIPYGGEYAYLYENYEKQKHGDETFEKIKDRIPADLGLVYWEYDATNPDKLDFMMQKHLTFNRPVMLSGGAWKWKQFTPRNVRTLKTIEAGCRAWNRNNFGDYLLTIWSDDAECPVYSILPCLVYAAECCNGNYDLENAKNRFEELFGESWDKFMLFDIPLSEDLPKHTPDANGIKAQFYADVFGCSYDAMLTGDGIVCKQYANFAKIFNKEKKNSLSFGYLYNFYETLCDFMSVKYELGYRIRVAYQAGDKKELKKLCDQIGAAIKKIKLFLTAYETAWRKDHKAYGLEVMQHRIGGQIVRMSDCQKRLTAYLKGEILSIDELEEKLVDYFTGGKELKKQVPTAWNYARVVTANRFIY